MVKKMEIHCKNWPAQKQNTKYLRNKSVTSQDNFFVSLYFTIHGIK